MLPTILDQETISTTQAHPFYSLIQQQKTLSYNANEIHSLASNIYKKKHSNNFKWPFFDAAWKNTDVPI